jgi:hypothetical protein
MEGGKTTTGVHILSHACLQGARLAIIDKHARSEEDSMTSKIRSLESCFDCPIGVDPATAIQSVQHVRNILDNRIEGAKCDYPLILVVDEFSAIMRQKEDGGKWQECGQILAGLIEDINMEGRKHKVFTVCIGQITNVSRSGGSEIRELFHTRIVHAMKEPQTRMLCLSDHAKDIRSLQKGECLIEMEGCEPFFVKVPHVQEEDIRKMVAQLPMQVVATRVLPVEALEAMEDLPVKMRSPELKMANFQLEEPSEDQREGLPEGTLAAYRQLGKLVRRGDSNSDIRKMLGVKDGRASQDVNAAIDYVRLNPDEFED